MSRRLLVSLLSALALLLAAAPAALAAPAPQASPTAAAAVADDACSDDPAVELPPCADDWADDEELCDPELSEEYLRAAAARDDEEWSDEEAWYDDGCEPYAPTISRLSATVAGRGARARVRVAFSLDGSGEIELTLARVEPGVVRGGRCAAAPARAAKKAKRGKRAAKPCARTVELRGSVVVDGEEGANSVELRRRWGGRALPAGSYKLTATPLEDGESVTASFALAGRPGR